MQQCPCANLSGYCFYKCVSRYNIDYEKISTKDNKSLCSGLFVVYMAFRIYCKKDNATCIFILLLNYLYYSIIIIIEAHRVSFLELMYRSNCETNDNSFYTQTACESLDVANFFVHWTSFGNIDRIFLYKGKRLDSRKTSCQEVNVKPE